MSISNQFKKFSQDMQKAVDKAGKQALKRAATSTRAKYAKDISGQLGVKSGVIKERARIESGGNGLKTTLSIGTRIRLAAQEFKIAKAKITSSKGLRIGATYLVKNVGKLLAPAGIIAVGKNSGKKIVLSRVAKNKMVTVRVEAFAEAVDKSKPELQSHMKDTFISNFNSSLKYYLSKLK